MFRLVWIIHEKKPAIKLAFVLPRARELLGKRAGDFLHAPELDARSDTVWLDSEQSNSPVRRCPDKWFVRVRHDEVHHVKVISAAVNHRKLPAVGVAPAGRNLTVAVTHTHHSHVVGDAHRATVALHLSAPGESVNCHC